MIFIAAVTFTRTGYHKTSFFSYFLIYSYVMKQFFDQFFVIIMFYMILWLRCPLYKQRFLWLRCPLYKQRFRLHGTSLFSRINCNVRDDFNEYDDHVLICSFFFCLDMRSVIMILYPLRPRSLFQVQTLALSWQLPNSTYLWRLLASLWM